MEEYGDLTDKAYLEFLNEIQNEDEDISNAQSEATEKIAIAEECEQLSEDAENAELEAYYGDDAWRSLANHTVLYGPDAAIKAIKSKREALKQKMSRLKEDRIRIQRLAFDQNIMPLSNVLDTNDIKMLIAELVKEHTRMLDKYETFINNRLAALLNPFIPTKLKTCKIAYPESIRRSPGFLYKASEEFGGGLSFWASPNIPYYFKQHTEQEILKKQKPDFLISIDKAVYAYHEHRQKRSDKELKCASKILQKRVKTYFDLLRLDPFWFEILYNIKKNEQAEDKAQNTSIPG